MVRSDPASAAAAAVAELALLDEGTALGHSAGAAGITGNGTVLSRNLLCSRCRGIRCAPRHGWADLGGRAFGGRPIWLVPPSWLPPIP